MAEIFNTSELGETTTLSPDEALWIYNGLDCCVTAEVFHRVKTLMTPEALKTYALSKALQAPILEMSLRGLWVDEARRQSVVTQLKAELELLLATFDRITLEGYGLETPINPASPAQLLWFFYEYLGLRPLRKKDPKTGKFKPAVGRPQLEKLAYNFWAELPCAFILAIRDLKKAIGFLESKVDSDGRMRSNYNIAGTETGRLSSSISDFGVGTNLQNVSSKQRSIFIPDPGLKFAEIDLEQADSRNIGATAYAWFYESHGPEWAGRYLDAAESGDLHTTVCRMAWQELDWGDDPAGWRSIANRIAYRHFSYRDLAKVLGHGTNYLGQPYTMAKHTKLPVPLISKFQSLYFEAFPEIPALHSEIERRVKKTSILTTIWNRTRTFYGRRNDPRTLNEAVAYMGQSPTADEINHSMLALWRDQTYPIYLCNQVHDSILFMYHPEHEADVIPHAMSLMQPKLLLPGGREFSVPVEAKVGWNWGSTKYNKDGSVKENEWGLQTWKGSDAARNEAREKLVA